jgi:hypothetical protein
MQLGRRGGRKSLRCCVAQFHSHSRHLINNKSENESIHSGVFSAGGKVNPSMYTCTFPSKFFYLISLIFTFKNESWVRQ